MSVDKVLNIAKTVTTIRVKLPHNESSMTRMMLLTEKQKLIAPLFDGKFWEGVK